MRENHTRQRISFWKPTRYVRQTRSRNTPLFVRKRFLPFLLCYGFPVQSCARNAGASHYRNEHCLPHSTTFSASSQQAVPSTTLSRDFCFFLLSRKARLPAPSRHSFTLFLRCSIVASSSGLHRESGELEYITSALAIWKTIMLKSLSSRDPWSGDFHVEQLHGIP